VGRANRRALGACIKKHRGRRSQQLLADSVGRSLRWVAYMEAGQTTPGWSDLATIAAALGPGAGQAFLDEAVAMLYEDLEVDKAMKEMMDRIQRRAFLGGIGAGALIDPERLSNALQKPSIDARLAEEMHNFTQFCVEQTRSLAPGVVLRGLRGHLRNYLELVMSARHGGTAFQAGASEAALLASVLYYRVGQTSEASRHLLVASGLAAEAGHTVVEANVLAVRAAIQMRHMQGWTQGDAKAPRLLLDRALAIAGPKSSGVLGATLLSWRSAHLASLSEATASGRDMDAAVTALTKPSPTRDVTGWGTQSEIDLAVEKTIAALHLHQPRQAIEALSYATIVEQPSRGWRAARLSDLAVAHAQSGETEASVHLLHEGMDLLTGGSDPYRYARIVGTRQYWLPKNFKSDALEELDQRLASISS
jgi:hypothetical protein